MRFWRGDLHRLTRALRFRLTASYVALFAVLLIGVAWLFRAQLKNELTTQAEDSLNEDWGATKASLLRIEEHPEGSGKYEVDWYYDPDDPDETTVVLDIKKVFVIADRDGKIVPDHAQEPSISTIYEDIGINPAAIRERIAEALKTAKPKPFFMDRRTLKGEPFKIRYGVQWDQKHQAPFYVALGTSLLENQKILSKYTWMIFMGFIPGALLLGSLLGWIMAGRVLTPVLEVAQAAQRISGSNLNLRIPTREAGDELDYLIATFNSMSERLAASFHQMKQFSADVSHELRTPITAIRGQLEVALFTAKTTDQYREAMFNALQDIDRLSQIVRALLLLSQAESGQLVLQKARLDLGEVARDLAEQFQIPAEAAGVRLTADLPGECVVDADRVQIERMITNLLSNALKFTPPGGCVKLAVRSTANNAEILVEDTGRGIAAEYLPHIFDRFYRVPGSGTAPGPEQGLGLGLSFVAWIVKAHRGTVDVESTPGEGTRFIVKLPSDSAAVSAPAPFANEVFSGNMTTPC